MLFYQRTLKLSAIIGRVKREDDAGRHASCPGRAAGAVRYGAPPPSCTPSTGPRPDSRRPAPGGRGRWRTGGRFDHLPGFTAGRLEVLDAATRRSTDGGHRVPSPRTRPGRRSTPGRAGTPGVPSRSPPLIRGRTRGRATGAGVFGHVPAHRRPGVIGHRDVEPS